MSNLYPAPDHRKLIKGDRRLKIIRDKAKADAEETGESMPDDESKEQKASYGATGQKRKQKVGR